jgi:acetoacetyl-CoA synthetase
MTGKPPLWTPPEARIHDSNLRRYQDRLEANLGRSFTDYAALHSWSIDEPEAFWQSVWDDGGVRASQAAAAVLRDGDRFPGARWFDGARLNFAENLLRRRDAAPALVQRLEDGSRRELSYAELYRRVAGLAAALRSDGVGPGDRVAGYLPNVIDTVVAMLATTSLGGVWSSCSPDFGFNGVMDRFGQIRPKVLFALDAYLYNGKRIDVLPRVRGIAAAIDSLERTVIVPVLDEEPDLSGIDGACIIHDYLDGDARDLGFAQLPFDHPLYVMYSSGTTGVPKCIVHSAGGTLLQHLKEHRLHVGLRPGDLMFFFTTCGWMMWNWLVSGLASGATLLLYDGSPLWRDGRVLLDLVDEEGIDVFGVGARYLAAIEKNGLVPRETHRLERLRTILSTGSPLSDESFRYVYRDIKADLCLSSISGGTDILSCFVLGNECLPVFEGELQCPGLGMAVEIRDDAGNPLPRGKGELVCTRPFPSCPIGFWNDPDGRRFHEAYFARFPGLWAHGDYGEFTEHGGMLIHGRSDAVLNPGGVRIGTAEIYRQVELVDEVLDSIVIGQSWQGDVRVVLFVQLREGLLLDDALREKIRRTIRGNATPRHVPARIVQVADLPRTLSGKLVELAVRKVVHGEEVSNRDALANPQALELFRDLPELRD